MLKVQQAILAKWLNHGPLSAMANSTSISLLRSERRNNFIPEISNPNAFSPGSYDKWFEAMYRVTRRSPIYWSRMVELSSTPFPQGDRVRSIIIVLKRNKRFSGNDILRSSVAYIYHQKAMRNEWLAEVLDTNPIVAKPASNMNRFQSPGRPAYVNQLPLFSASPGRTMSV